MESTSAILGLAALLFFKHLLADGPLQTRYQLAHKGEFLHPGGLLHSFIHAALTVVCLAGWIVANGRDLDASIVILASVIGTGEFLIHYFCDFFKVRIDRQNKWSVTEMQEDGQVVLKITSGMFFIAFLADQTAHSMTYILILYIVGFAL